MAQKNKKSALPANEGAEGRNGIWMPVTLFKHTTEVLKAHKMRIGLAFSIFCRAICQAIADAKARGENIEGRVPKITIEF